MDSGDGIEVVQGERESRFPRSETAMEPCGHDASAACDRLVADVWCWFVLREKYYWLVVDKQKRMCDCSRSPSVGVPAGAEWLHWEIACSRTDRSSLCR
jgi:hypothetical protein